MKQGTPVRLIDGKGNLYEGIIDEDDPKRCVVRIEKAYAGFEKRNFNLHIAISPLKNPDRFEWFVEKSVEIGIDEITPLLCRNTEKTGIKRERIENLIVSAMKQSLKAYGTRLNEPMGFREFLKEENAGLKMIAHCNKGFDRNKITDIYRAGKDAVILIGPEGDFSEDEIALASEYGFSPIHLGPSRLRTETAGVAACHSIYLLNQ